MNTFSDLEMVWAIGKIRQIVLPGAVWKKAKDDDEFEVLVRAYAKAFLSFVPFPKSECERQVFGKRPSYNPATGTVELSIASGLHVVPSDWIIDEINRTRDRFPAPIQIRMLWEQYFKCADGREWQRMVDDANGVVAERLPGT